MILPGNFIEKDIILTKDFHSKSNMEKNILLQHMKHTT